MTKDLTRGTPWKLILQFALPIMASNTDGCAVCGKHPTITELIDYEQVVCTDGI